MKLIVTPGQGVAFQRRLANNDAGVTINQTGVQAPLWVKLVRTGNLLTAQHSADGKTWVDVTSTAGASSDTVVMGGTIYIGLALTSHSEGVATTAEFSGIQITGGVSGQWQVADIGVEHPGNSPDILYVAVQDASKTVTLTHPDENAVLQTTWQRWTIDLASLQSQGLNLKAIKKMSIGIGDRKNPQPDGTGTVYIDDIRLTKGVPVEPNMVP